MRYWLFPEGHMRSPLSLRPSGEWNAMKSGIFGDSELTFVSTLGAIVLRFYKAVSGYPPNSGPSVGATERLNNAECEMIWPNTGALASVASSYGRIIGSTIGIELVTRQVHERHVRRYFSREYEKGSQLQLGLKDSLKPYIIYVLVAFGVLGTVAVWRVHHSTPRLRVTELPLLPITHGEVNPEQEFPESFPLQ